MTQSFATPRRTASTRAALRSSVRPAAISLPTGCSKSTLLTVMVIDDELTVGTAVRSALRTDGHVVHVRTHSDAVVEEVAYLRPDVVVLNLGAETQTVRALLDVIRMRFPCIYVVVYTDGNVNAVRAQFRPDLVLSKQSPFCMALQTRCWARHLD